MGWGWMGSKKFCRALSPKQIARVRRRFRGTDVVFAIIAVLKIDRFNRRSSSPLLLYICVITAEKYLVIVGYVAPAG